MADTIFRLSDAEFNKLEDKVKSILPVVPKTELEAGMKLGVQHVLDAIRHGFKIG